MAVNKLKLYLVILILNNIIKYLTHIEFKNLSIQHYVKFLNF